MLKPIENDGIIVYAVGVGKAISNELLEIASEPINRHKFSVSDFDAIEEIRSNLRRTICIDSICPTMNQHDILSTIGYFEEQHLGFDILEKFTESDENNLKADFETMLGSGYVTTRRASSNLQLTSNRKPTRIIFPRGLPDQYTIVFLFEAIKKMKSWVPGLTPH